MGHAWRDWDFGDGVIEPVVDPHPPERMMPLTDRATEGRANVKGIPCFYAATKQATAVAEMRPWIGSYVSVGQFVLTKAVKILNFVTDQSHQDTMYFDEPDASIRTELVWESIDEAFSEPVEHSDDSADYAPTQILAELFKLDGFDGIAYRSSVGEGHNLAFFDPSIFELHSCHLMRVEKIDVKYSETTNPYTVKSPKPGRVNPS